MLAVAHAKGGVGKTTTALITGKYLARRHRVALVDYDEGAHLTDLVRDLSADGDGHTVTRRLWLRNGTPDNAEIVVIDSAPARGPETRRALVEADYVLIPAPPERMAVRAMQQMLDTVDEVRGARVGGNPYLAVLGVVPTMYHPAWPEHRAYLDQMAEESTRRGIRLFPPVHRRQSYLYLSVAGQDYRPIAEAIEAVLEPQLSHA
ncbi:MAG: ParA family protein [Chloroflexi bacterium]|nr:ParA family protein [Chloroflexota bacterium]